MNKEGKPFLCEKDKTTHEKHTKEIIKDAKMMVRNTRSLRKKTTHVVLRKIKKASNTLNVLMDGKRLIGQTSSFLILNKIELRRQERENQNNYNIVVYCTGV